MATYILASQSPRRKQLLSWAEVEFDILIPDTDESFPPDSTPAKAAEYIAAQKAEAVLPQLGNEQTVIAADTIVVLNNEIIGKPANREEAIATLTKLSGQTHSVVTGVCIKSKSKSIIFSDITQVQFHFLTQEQIIFYVDKYQPYDKAGAYAIQEWIGVVGIRCINGDFYNVMGLPVSRVVQALQTF